MQSNDLSVWAKLSKQVDLIVAQSESSFASMLVKKHMTDSLRSRNVSVFTVLERCYVKGVMIVQHTHESFQSFSIPHAPLSPARLAKKARAHARLAQMLDLFCRALCGQPLVLPMDGQIPSERPHPSPAMARDMRSSVRVFCLMFLFSFFFACQKVVQGAGGCR